MTNEDAIKYFKMRVAERTHPPTTAQQKAFNVAIEALEKQEREKPKKRTNYDDIREFTVNQLAFFLAELAGGGKEREKAFKTWLMEEAEE